MFIITGCASVKEHESAQETEAALGSVVGAISGQEVDQDELEDLLTLATVGDIRAIRQQLDVLVQQNPDMQTFANRLTILIKEFRIDDIRELLTSLQKQEEVPKVS